MKRLTLGLLIGLALSVTSFAQQRALLLFGGRDHDDFLGCLNCSSFDRTSLCNSYGMFGNDFSSKSIWNGFSKYGNSFASSSPWNTFATYPPVVVDTEGRFYGYFTANESHPRRVTSRLFLLVIRVAAEGDLEGARNLLCGE